MLPAERGEVNEQLVRNILGLAQSGNGALECERELEGIPLQMSGRGIAVPAVAESPLAGAFPLLEGATR